MHPACFCGNAQRSGGVKAFMSIESSGTAAHALMALARFFYYGLWLRKEYDDVGNSSGIGARSCGA